MSLSSTELLRKGYVDIIQPLSTVVGLSEYLAEQGHVSMDTVDQLNQLEDEQAVGIAKAKEILIDILVSKGVAKVVEIKKSLREYAKSTKMENAIERKPRPKPRPRSSTKVGVVSPEIEKFSVLFYTLMQKLLSSCQKSQTVRSRLPWLQHTSTVSVKEFFPISALEDLHDVSREEISVSVETLLEAYKQLWSGGRVRERERDNGETAELRKEIEKLLLKISQTENKLDEAHQINKHWSIECSDLKKELAKVNRDRSKDNSSDRVKELEVQLRESIRKEDYELLLTEKNELQVKLEEIEGHNELVTSEISSLQTEVQYLKETNEAILVDMEELKKENEMDKSYIEELRIQISNLRQSNEPSVREMSLLLEKNRALSDRIIEAEDSLKVLREEKVTYTDQLEELLKEKEMANKELEIVKDELMALRTHISDLEVINKQHKDVHRNKTTPIAPPIAPYNKGDIQGLLSFNSQQRKCPNCEHIFTHLNQKEFTHHVAECFI